MIKIQHTLFDKDTILKIYEENSTLIKEIENKITKEVGHGNALADKLFFHWFYEGEIISRQRISSFLLERNPVKYINEFAEIISQELWGNTALSKSLLFFKYNKKKSIEAKKVGERIELLYPIVNESTCSMFLIDGSPINAGQVSKEAKRNTLFSNKEKIKKLELKEQRKIDDVMSICQRIFNYDSFSTNYRRLLLSAMHVNVCPYCNRQYISSYIEQGTLQATADIDHFYAKDYYPFLAISLFNFVPSCTICNSRLKHTSDFYVMPHINPHNSEFGDRAIFRLRNINSIACKDESPDVYIEYIENDEEVANSIHTFRLESIYNASHKDFVRDLITKAQIFSDQQLQEYLGLFDGLFQDKDEMRRIIYGTYLQNDQLGFRPMSKLSRDILLDLGIKI